MCIGRKRFMISLALIASMFLPSVSLAAQEQKATNTRLSDWSLLNAVTTGSKVAVKLKDGKTVEGKLGSVSDTGLSLSVKDKPVDVKREDVLSVYQITKKSAKKATLIGLGVGAGAGAGIALAGRGEGYDKLENLVLAGFTVIGAGAGALTGYLIGRSGHKRVLIYHAGQP